MSAMGRLQKGLHCENTKLNIVQLSHFVADIIEIICAAHTNIGSVWKNKLKKDERFYFQSVIWVLTGVSYL